MVGVAVVVLSGCATEAPLSGNGSIAFVRSDGIYVVDPGGGPAELLIADGRAEDPSWSPDGSRIAYVRKGPPDVVVVANDDGSDPTPLFGRDWLEPSTEVSRPAWSPVGDELVFAGTWTAAGAGASGCLELECLVYARASLYRVPASGGRPELAMEPRTMPGEVAWAPGDRIIILGARPHPILFEDPEAFDPEVHDGDGGLFLVHPWTGAASRVHVRRVGPPGEMYGELAWSPDGRRLAFVDVDFDIWALDVERGVARELRGGDLPARVGGFGESFSGPVWSPDGRSLAFAARGGIHVGDADGQGARIVAPGHAWAPAWQPVAS